MKVESLNKKNIQQETENNIISEIRDYINFKKLEPGDK